MAKILIISEKGGMAGVLKPELALLGYEIFNMEPGLVASAGHGDYGMVLLFPPTMERMGSLVRTVRENPAFHYLPVWVVDCEGYFAQKKEEEIIRFSNETSTDNIIYSSSMKLVASRVDRYMRRVMVTRSMSPLTGLPGNLLIEGEIEERIIKRGRNNSVIYADINNFKAYNDLYGFSAGDRVIRFFAEISFACLAPYGTGAFIGHIGGDDFVMIVPAAHADGVARDIIDRFKHGLRNFYRPLDYERECIISFDRRGQRQKFGLMSLTMVSFSNAARAFSNTVELAEFAGILKHMGKQQSAAAQKSVYLKGDELEMERGPFSLLNIAQDAAIPVRFRRSAIEAMGESQEKQREDSLIELLDKDLPYLLKKSCIYALGRLRAIKAVPKLVNFVRDSNPHLRTRAVEALGNIGMVETVDMLIEALGDENIYTRRMAALALGKMGDRKAIEPLMKLLKAKDTRLRMNAVISLGELKDEGSIPLIMELMASSDTDIKKRAIWALGQMHSAAAIDKLIVMLGTEKKEMRYGIALALYEIIENAALSDVEKYTDSIVEYSYDNEPSIRKVFMSILGVLPDSPQAIKRLKECLKDRSGYVRWHATLALGRKKDKSIPPFLAGQLRDKSSQVRIAAAQRLGEIGNPDALEPLRKLLKDENMEVTQQAADAIIRILRKCGIPSQPGGPRVDL